MHNSETFPGALFSSIDMREINVPQLGPVSRGFDHLFYEKER
jgi:hypothetical protein